MYYPLMIQLLKFIVQVTVAITSSASRIIRERVKWGVPRCMFSIILFQEIPLSHNLSQHCFSFPKLVINFIPVGVKS